LSVPGLIVEEFQLCCLLFKKAKWAKLFSAKLLKELGFLIVEEFQTCFLPLNPPHRGGQGQVLSPAGGGTTSVPRWRGCRGWTDVVKMGILSRRRPDLMYRNSKVYHSVPDNPLNPPFLRGSTDAPQCVSTNSPLIKGVRGLFLTGICRISKKSLPKAT
jgi:hypothetical protein